MDYVAETTTHAPDEVTHSLKDLEISASTSLDCSELVTLFY